MVKRIRLPSAGNSQHSPKVSTPVPTRNGRGGGKTEYWTVDQVAKALRKNAGIRSHAARWLKEATGRGSGDGRTVSDYIIRHPELERVMEEVKNATLDLAESKLVAAIENEQRTDHLRAVTYYLSTQGKQRGYTRREELTGAGGRPLYPDRRLDLTRLSDDELDNLERLYEKAEVHDSDERRTTAGDQGNGTYGGNGRGPAGEGQA